MPGFSEKPKRGLPPRVAEFLDNNGPAALVMAVALASGAGCSAYVRSIIDRAAPSPEDTLLPEAGVPADETVPRPEAEGDWVRRPESERRGMEDPGIFLDRVPEPRKFWRA